jgi:sugar lactone lactonase YvrE
MGLVYDLAADSDFASLRGTGEWTDILRRMEANRRPVARARTAFALGEADLIPEDIAYDAKTARFFVSSVRKGKILTGEGREFARTEWPVLGLAVDARRRRLWATSGWMPQCERCAAGDRGKTVLLAFHLDTGALVRRIEAGGEGVLSDMTIGRNGDLYVSNSSAGAVYHLAPDGNALSRLDATGEFPSPQTPALSTDEKTLYVPDYVRGIGAIDLATRALRWLVPAEGIALSGIDGLYVHGDSFLAVQNGTEPRRVVRFSLDLRKQSVLEANTPGLGEPTHGTIVGGTFYFLANTGWEQYDGEGRKAGGAAVRSSVRKIHLPGAMAGPSRAPACGPRKP